MGVKQYTYAKINFCEIHTKFIKLEHFAKLENETRGTFVRVKNSRICDGCISYNIRRTRHKNVNNVRSEQLVRTLIRIILCVCAYINPTQTCHCRNGRNSDSYAWHTAIRTCCWILNHIVDLEKLKKCQRLRFHCQCNDRQHHIHMRLKHIIYFSFYVLSCFNTF